MSDQGWHEDFGDEPGIEERIPEGWDFEEIERQQGVEEKVEYDVQQKGPYSILYTIEYGEIMQCGPFKNEQEAMKYVRGHCYTEGCNEYEFDLNDQHVYLLHPDHRMIELSVSVLSESV